MVAAAGNGPSALWYFARGSGFAALALLTASVAGGVLTSTRYEAPTWPRFVVRELHRRVSLLVVAFLALHIVTVVLDPFARLGPRDALVPFSSAYRPIWLGLGVVASELLVALVVTSLVRRRLGFRSWRLVHWLAYVCWPAALVHGIGTGTDTRSFWGLVLDAVSLGTVALAVAWRLSDGWPHRAVRRVALGALTAAGIVAVSGWAMAGPLRAGWARAAGTPPVLLTAGGDAAPTRAASPAPSAPAAGRIVPAPPPTPLGSVPVGLQAEFEGTVRDEGNGAAVITATTAGLPSLALTIDVLPAGAAAPRLTIAEGGRTLCSTALSQNGGLVARCDSTLVRLHLEQGQGGAVFGILTTETGG